MRDLDVLPRKAPRSAYGELEIQLNAVAVAHTLALAAVDTDAGQKVPSDLVNPVVKMKRQDWEDGTFLALDASYATQDKDLISLKVEHKGMVRGDRVTREYLATKSGDIYHILEDDEGVERTYRLNIEESKKVADIVNQSFVVSFE